MNLKRSFLISIITLVAIGIYIFPKMINQRSYDRYLVYVPETKLENGKHPLLLYLHGSGSRGSDISKLEGSGPSPYLKKNKDYPFIVVTPQCNEGDSWHALYLHRLIDTIEANYPIDPDRIYVTGLSMGGIGTWSIAAFNPGRFAAIAPVCARSPFATEEVSALKDLSIWAFHGKKDDVIPYQETEKLVNKLEALDADVNFTLYSELGHAIWDETYYKRS